MHIMARIDCNTCTFVVKKIQVTLNVLDVAYDHLPVLKVFENIYIAFRYIVCHSNIRE